MKDVFRKKRVFFFLSTIVLLLIEIIIALYVNDRIIRPYVGDILVTLLIYCFIRTLFAKGFTWLPLWVFLFACFVEFLQYLNFVEIIGVSENVYMRTIIGTSFSWLDIVCYGIGCILCFIFQLSEPRIFSRNK
ncbi:MAG: DUF2809 domain-containing protein [Bacteroidales bacterium]|nr:DUF2809 domain-containing protein [Bacteroidales bacterium]